MSSNMGQDDTLDLMRLFRSLWRHRWRFAVWWFIFALLAAAVIAHLSPTFEASGSVYLEEKDGSSTVLGAIMPLLPGLSNGDDLESSKQLIASRQLGINAISKLGLNAELDGPSQYLPAEPFFWQWYFNRDPQQFARGLTVHDVAVAQSVFDEIELDVEFLDAQRFRVLSDQTQLGEGRLGSRVKTAVGSFVLEYTGRSPITAGTRFELTLQPAYLTYDDDFRKVLTVKGGGPLTAPNRIIAVSYKSNSPVRAAAVVQTLIDAFVELKHQWATSVTVRTLDFISRQIDFLKKDMDDAFSQLAKYQEESGAIALSPQAQAELTRLVETEIEMSKQRMAEEALRSLSKSLDTGNPDLYLMAGIDAPLIQASGQKLSQINSEIAAQRSQFQEGYPPLQKLLSARDALLKDLKSSVNNLIENARTNQKALKETIGKYRRELAQLPGQAKLLAEFQRKTRVFEGLYMTLVQERQKAQIAKESTLTNVKLVDRPLVPLDQHSPKLILAVTAFLLAGFFAAVCTAWPILRVRGFESAPEVREHFKQPVFSVVPYRGQRLRRGAPATLEPNAQSPFMEAIRLLRANLLHTMAGRTQQLVLVTSAMPEDGKTSVSVNLAAAMSRSDRVERVLLIDADMHKPSIHTILQLPPSPGLSQYLNGQASIEQIVHPVELRQGQSMDVIPAGPVPPTPGDLVDTALMRRLLDYTREHYTFVFLDSPPYPLISTASILSPQVDRVLSVCRLAKTDRAIFRRHVEDLTALNRQMGLVINAGVSGDGYGGYGYSRSAYAYAGSAAAGSNGNGSVVGVRPDKPRRQREPVKSA